MDCLECGEKDFATCFMEPIKTELLDASLCHGCWFWAEYYREDRTSKRACVVDGTHYHISPSKHDNTQWNGCGGAWFYVQFGDGRLLKSNNVWVQGGIPEHWRSRHEDNAKFLTKESFELAATEEEG